MKIRIPSPLRIVLLLVAASAAALPALAQPTTPSRADQDRTIRLTQEDQLKKTRTASGGELVDPSGAEVPPVSIMGLDLIRDQFVQDLLDRAREWRALRDASRRQKVATARELRKRADDARAAYETMIYMRNEANRAGPQGITGKDRYDAVRKSAAEALRRGDVKAAREALERSKKLPYGQYLDWGRRYYSILDAAPLLGIEADGSLLWQALLDDALDDPQGRTRAERDQPLVEILNDYLDEGVKQARDQAEHARGEASVEDLWKYGGAGFARQQQAAKAWGESRGSILVGPMIDAAVGVHEGWRTIKAFDDALFDIQVGIGGVLLLPLGPIVCAGYVGFEVVRDGADLGIRVFTDEAEARKRAKVSGHVHIFTAEQRSAAASDRLTMTVLTGLPDLILSARGFRVLGRTRPAGECAAPARVGDEPADASRAARGRETVAEDLEMPPPADVDAPPAPVARSGDTEIELFPAEAMERWGRGASDRHLAARIRGAEEAVRQARAAGVPEARIADVLERAATERLIGRATKQVVGELGVASANARRGRIYVAFSEADDFEAWRGAVEPDDLHVRGDLDLFPTIKSKAALEAAGKPQAWTPAERALLEEILRHPDDRLLEWRTFEMIDVAEGLRPVFRQDDLDNLRAVRPSRTTGEDAPRSAAADPAPSERGLDGKTDVDETAPLARNRSDDTVAEDLEMPPPAARIDPDGPAAAAPPLLTEAEYRSMVARQVAGETIDLTDVARPGIAKVVDGEVLVTQGAGRWEKARPDEYVDLFVDSRATLPPELEAVVLETGVRADLVRDANLLSSRGKEGMNPTIVEASLGDAPSFTRVRIPARNVDAPTSFMPHRIEEILEDLRASGVDTARLETALASLSPAERLELLTNDVARTRDLETGQVPRRGPGETQEVLESEVFPRGRPRTGDRNAPAEAEAAPPDAAPPADGASGASETPEIATRDGVVVGMVPPIRYALYPSRERDGGDEDPRTEPDAGTEIALGNPGEMPARDVNPPGLETASRDPATQLVIVDGPQEAVEAAPAGATRPAPGGYVAVGPDGELRVLVESLGGLGEGAIQLRVFNGTDSPVRLTGEGLVVEPVELEEEAKRRIVEELRDLAGRNPVTAKIDAYCLEFLREPPTAGTVFRIASQELQQRFAPLRDVLSASRRLQEAGLLNPDSDPTEYFHSIRQWALWTVEENLDADGFGRAFLEHIRSNFEEAGQPWTEEARELIEGLVPNRWKDVRQVVEKAREMTDANREESP